MFVPLLIVIIGFCGLALDMGQVYNRKVDVHGIAKVAALAAAAELNGTPEGIAAAKVAARNAVARLRYRRIYIGVRVPWSDEALRFGASSSRAGTWLSSGEVGGSSSQAATLMFARVDTAGLGQELGTVETYFMRILSSRLATVEVSDTAIAGRTASKVTPIGVCAMSSEPAAAREATKSDGTKVYELVQYGFRCGVSYDLMQLNPNGVEPLRYTINPVAQPGTSGPTFSEAALEPFVCHGSIWVNRLAGDTIRVSELPSSSPLASLRSALNTRFDNYTGTVCTPRGAAPDANVKSYAYDQLNVVKWMSPGKGTPAAATTKTRSRLETEADLPTPPTSPGNYGPLWAYAKAAKLASATDLAEPAGGYATFQHTDWPTLYPSGPTASNYPSQPPVPYLSGLASTGFYQAPSAANRPTQLPERRVLHIPLLSCSPSAPSGFNVPATAVAIGRFFMTVPATNDSLIGEFAGTISVNKLPGQVELFL